MITQEDLEKSDKLSFIHERFKKHSPAPMSHHGIVLCSSCGMPVDGKDPCSIVSAPSIGHVQSYLSALEMTTSGNDMFIKFGTWVQHYVPDPQVGRVMQSVMSAGLYKEPGMQEVVALLSPWALYHYLFHLNLLAPNIRPGWEQLRKVMLAKSIAENEYRLPFMLAQFVDKQPLSDTWNATADSPEFRAMYEGFRKRYEQMKGVCNI